MTAPAVAPTQETRTPTWFGWLALFVGVWLTASLVVVVNALNTGLTDDVGASPYHVPFYLCLVALAVLSVWLVVRAVRGGRRWTEAFPPGYGTLPVGLLVLLAWFLLDVGWREGVGIKSDGVETGMAPSRIVLAVGVLLILVAPLRAALRAGLGVNRWPAVFSAAILAALVQPTGFHPAQDPWLEHVPVEPSGEVWVMEPDGSRQTRLTRAGDGVQAWNPVPSPDGTRIAFTLLRQGDHPPVDIPDEADVWVMAADGSDARPVAAFEGWQWLPHWSPDGTWIVYTDESEGGPWATDTGPPVEGSGGLLGIPFLPGQQTPDRRPADIWKIRADGTGRPIQLTNAPGDDRAATYSPDGTKLVFDATRDGNTEIYVMDADGQDQRRLTYDPDNSDWGASWSPDGKWIAFNPNRTGDPGIYVMAADGTALRQVANLPGPDAAPSWSPDGTHIAFWHQGNGPQGEAVREIWSVSAIDGGDLRNLSQTPRAWEDIPSGGGAWGADGRIVYERALDPPASADRLVRNDLGAAAMLLVAILVSLAAVIVRIEPPFGSFALIMGISTALIGGMNDEWRFVPAAVAGGLIVDLLVRYAPRDQTAHVAGAGLALTVVLGAGATVVFTTGLGWSPTLLLGVAMAAGAVGWVIGGLVGRRPPASEPALPI
jgi:WD40-like Beta Propeller Repeat